MPTIFLSPATQEETRFVSGGSQRYWMNRLADEMEPWLTACGIAYVRSSPTGSATQAIRQSNAGDYGLHLCLHTGAAPESIYGQRRGIDAFYYPASREGRRAAERITEALKSIYPDPGEVRALGADDILELRETRAPAVFLQLGYHDNREDAGWILSNLSLIARTIVQGVAGFFGVPFREPGAGFPRRGTVRLTSGTLNLRQAPNLESAVLASIPNGAMLEIQGDAGDWYAVRFEGKEGYAAKAFVETA